MDDDLENLIKARMKDIQSSIGGPFSRAVAMDISCQIARGMLYLHKQGNGHGRLSSKHFGPRPKHHPRQDSEFISVSSVDMKIGTYTSVKPLGQKDVWNFAEICCRVLCGIIIPLGSQGFLHYHNLD